MLKKVEKFPGKKVWKDFEDEFLLHQYCKNRKKKQTQKEEEEKDIYKKNLKVLKLT